MKIFYLQKRKKKEEILEMDWQVWINYLLLFATSTDNQTYFKKADHLKSKGFWYSFFLS